MIGRRSHEDELYALNNRLAVIARERERERRKLEQALAERERAYWHLRKLQELLPMCMDCHDIRPEGSWVGIADYLRENGILVSHGLCDPCCERRAAGLDDRPVE